MSLRSAVPIAHGIESDEDGKKWLNLVQQRLVDVRKEELTFDPASVAPNTTVEQSVTLTGLKSQDIVIAVIKPTLTAGLGVLQGRVSADDTLVIQLINTTSGAIDAASEVYTVIYIKNSGV